MASIRSILARRDEIRTELHSISSAHPDTLPADQQARWTQLSAEADRLTEQEARQAMLDDLDRRAAGLTLNGTGSGDATFDALAGRVTVLDVIRAQAGGTDAAAGRAKEVSAELARRSGRAPQGLFFPMGAITTEQRIFGTTAPAGGPGSSLIQTTVSPTMIDRLRERVLARKLGATVLGGLQGNLAIPRLKASATASWVAENGAVTASDPQAEQVSLSPKHAGGIVELSRQVLQQSSPDVAAMVESDLVQILAVALDQAAIQGGGSNAPSGILAAGSGITVVAGGTNGLAPTWANILALIGAIDSSNALAGSLAFGGNAKVTKALRTILKTTADTSSNFIMTDPNSLAGYTYASSQNVPSNLTKGSGTGLSALVFGDWSQLIIGFWSELDVLVNPYESTAYSKGNVQVRAMLTADVKLRQPLAFAAITDLIAP
jgi:HK97 family phage major capsid protein